MGACFATRPPRPGSHIRLYLMQHGKSKSKDEDPDRPLTDEGRAEVERIAAFLAQAAPARGMLIHHSGKTRARQTAEALAAVFENATAEAADGLAPLDDPAIWAERAGAAGDALVLVGHLPHLSRLASLLLTGGEDSEPVAFSNGGMVCLARREDGRWTLLWSVVPALLS